MPIAPSASNSITVRLKITNRPGMLGRVTSAIGKAGGDIGAVDLVDVTGDYTVRDVTVNVRDEKHGDKVIRTICSVSGIELVNVSDLTFLMHLGGKIEVTSKFPLKTRADLSRAYTPGVARVCLSIAADKSKVHSLTIKKNMVAVVTDGSAILGLGNLGPEAALPVMEGKAMLFKEFAGVDAFPLALATQDVDEIVCACKAIAPVFGGINLEDISAPRCFEVEDRLKKELNIPVMHDDQHGTAVVVLAALINALRIVKKKPEKLRIVVSGIGAAGVACTKILMAYGVRHFIGFDREGPLFRGRTERMNPAKIWYAEHTNAGGFRGSREEALKDCDVFIGLSGPGTVKAKWLKKMAKNAIVFAMANPVPEIMPEEAAPYVRIMATGRSDYPNQINNVLAFPGIFRGALDCRAREINEAMKLAAAEAIASIINPNELSVDYIIPSVFDQRVAKAVAQGVMRAAQKTGAARRQKPRSATSFRG
ncbi:MAG TPA: malic enzyme-like NAD(P)-binding protein [Acidobacteriota bacterium]|jgi:malate dehydrogenase (oxaloacetate-decarboxylating)|nr:malic enzyme-like NAD(P)-binding protein [Acidobacteriota bacterium]